MLVATFGPNTGWAGRTITRNGETFILEGHGPISAQDVMEYDGQGHLVWANDETRAWVGSKARDPEPLRADAATEMMAGDLVGAWRLFMDNEYDKALAILRHVVPDGLTDAAEAQDAARLASRIRERSDERLYYQCDDLIAAAQAAIGHRGVVIERAKYLGSHSELGTPRDGTLEITSEYVDLIWRNSGRPFHKRLPMSSITSIGVDGGQVAQSKLLPFLAFGIIGALLAKGSTDGTFLSAHSHSGEVAVYAVDSKSPGEMRAALEPVLRVAGVPFDDDLPQNVRQTIGSADPDDAPHGSAADEIAKLGELRVKGLLTDEEFEAAKQKILGAL